MNIHETMHQLNIELSAGGPGSGRKPGWGSSSKNKGLLNDLHKTLTKEMGFKYQSSNKTKEGAEHVYTGKEKSGASGTRILKEDNNGGHSFSLSAAKLAKDKHESDDKIQAPSDLAKQKGVAPNKDGKLIADEE